MNNELPDAKSEQVANDPVDELAQIEDILFLAENELTGSGIVLAENKVTGLSDQSTPSMNTVRGSENTSNPSLEMSDGGSQLGLVQISAKGSKVSSTQIIMNFQHDSVLKTVESVKATISVAPAQPFTKKPEAALTIATNPIQPNAICSHLAPNTTHTSALNLTDRTQPSESSFFTIENCAPLPIVAESGSYTPEAIIIDTEVEIEPEIIVAEAEVEPKIIVAEVEVEPEIIVTEAKAEAEIEPKIIVMEAEAEIEPEIIVTEVEAKIEPEIIVVEVEAEIEPEIEIIVAETEVEPEIIVAEPKVEPEIIVAETEVEPETIVVVTEAEPDIIVLKNAAIVDASSEPAPSLVTLKGVTNLLNTMNPYEIAHKMSQEYYGDSKPLYLHDVISFVSDSVVDLVEDLFSTTSTETNDTISLTTLSDTADYYNSTAFPSILEHLPEQAQQEAILVAI